MSFNRFENDRLVDDLIRAGASEREQRTTRR